MSEYIKARKSQINYYRGIPLYTKAEANKFVLYKKRGVTLNEMRIQDGRHPAELHIKISDKIEGIQEAQKGFNKQLGNDVKSGDPVKVKETLVTVVEETLLEPRSGSLEGVSETVDILLSDYAGESDVIQNLLDIAYTDYSTILHSINVMVFALVFTSYSNFSRDDAKVLGLSALLHDVGKTKINPEIITAPRKLTEEEFDEMKSHTLKGYDILRECKFGLREISLAALEHHEKLDGSGYPNGKKKISEIAQILAIIDCYEALTCDDRPYRSKMEPYDAFKNIIEKDLKAGKFNKNIYTHFVKSLAGGGR
jgi:HD-GYP domain-containing protein (c-di-GMP phosphodiesterase class II)